MDYRNFFDSLSEEEQKAMKNMDEGETHYVSREIERIKAVMIDLGQDDLDSSVNQKIADLLLGEANNPLISKEWISWGMNEYYPNVPVTESLNLSDDSWKYLRQEIWYMELSIKTNQALRINNIVLIGDIAQLTEDELTKIKPVLWKKEIGLIKSELIYHGLSLGMKLNDWTRPNFVIIG